MSSFYRSVTLEPVSETKCVIYIRDSSTASAVNNAFHFQVIG